HAPTTAGDIGSRQIRRPCWRRWLIQTAVLGALGGLLVGLFWGVWCGIPSSPPDGEGPKVVLVIQGGAGILDEDEMREAGWKRVDFEEGLADALRAGWRAMQEEGTSVDAVEAAIRSMEDSPLFNAGKGAALCADGKARLDAAIMEGRATPPAEGQA